MCLYPNTFDAFLDDDEFNYREAIMSIKAFRFPLSIYSECFNENTQYSQVIDDINIFKNKVLTLNSNELKVKLVNMLKICKKTSHSLFLELNKKLLLNYNKNKIINYKYSYINGKNCFFTKGVNGLVTVNLPFSKKLFLYNSSFMLHKTDCTKIYKLLEDRENLKKLYLDQMRRFGLTNFIIWPHGKSSFFNFVAKKIIFTLLFIFFKLQKKDKL